MSVTDELWLHAVAVAYTLDIEEEEEEEEVGAGREDAAGAVVDILQLGVGAVSGV